ncbi:uncharacterized protein MONOS_8534 [Monocercomonoides exilis]|uniref:uncharacterized protein n=1 Tax=Monocercomonoides exilis TaxID=2049356 RepID=UPI0035596C10|nr:hypothetical protein MONOS_8534 [Monocercomonoides exilis]|eukprot:MONOS_8534.1-p1 / transcript=MONOS_8534.1 / gene=MONOS_8534 / organism=Monocercomonoides_exilis_PA203 / gene_product=unspecified product / transcript_product=unspecified product / location=Mono_scaffold00324:35608-37010(+) / protein_length=295 / sequence_SO=supercontig / SO=protein_coding / is_pseudo=false
MSITEKFTALFDGLEECDEEEQMQKIKEMNEMINEMNRDEFKSEIEQKLYLKEIKEIIKYHQEHQNLTRLAYQSAWQFLIKRLYNDKSLEEVIVNDLHFAREAAKELEDLSKCVDLKRKEERAKEAKEVIVIWRWMLIIYEFFFSCTLRNEELAKLTASLVRLFRAAKDKYPDISRLCIFSLKDASDKKNMEIDVLQKKGVIVLFSDEMKQSTLDDDILWNCLHFFLNISERLKEKKDDETEEEERKEMKRKIFERMEEEGYEDIVESLNGVISYIKEKFTELSKYIKDYFVNS